MKVRIAKTRRGLIVSFFGLAAVLLVMGILTLPYFLEPAPSPEEAETRIRLLLKREFFNREMTMVRKSGRRLPDHERARQWKEETRRIDRIRFLSIRVNRLIPDVPLLDPAPHFVVRVKTQDGGSKARTRYFLLSAAGIDTETSYPAWFFSI